LKETTSELFYIDSTYAHLGYAYLRNNQVAQAAAMAKIFLKNKKDNKTSSELILVSKAAIALENKQPLQSMQALFSAIDLTLKKKYELIKNSTITSSLQYDTSIAKLETQLLSQQLEMNDLELEWEKDKQKLSKQTITIIVLVAIALFTAVIFLLQSRRYFKRRSQTDFLTQVSNRRYIFEEGEKLLSRAKRQRKDFSLIIFDIDNFKMVNDQHGHDIGDKTIQAAAKQAKHWLRDKDILGRIGGEEFLILLPLTEPKKAMEIAERLREGIANKIFHFNQTDIKFTISLGIASVKRKTINFDQLVKNADDALYEAKESGRNKSVSA